MGSKDIKNKKQKKDVIVSSEVKVEVDSSGKVDVKPVVIEEKSEKTFWQKLGIDKLFED